MTPNQIKMAKLRAMKKKKVGKKGGCAGPKCMCGCGKKGQCGEGARLKAAAEAAKKAAKAAAEAAKKAAKFAKEHRKEIAGGIGAAAAIGSQLTGNKALSTVSDIADVLGRGRGQRGRGFNTGELHNASNLNSNSAIAATGQLIF